MGVQNIWSAIKITWNWIAAWFLFVIKSRNWKKWRKKPTWLLGQKKYSLLTWKACKNWWNLLFSDYFHYLFGKFSMILTGWTLNLYFPILLLLWSRTSRQHCIGDSIQEQFAQFEHLQGSLILHQSRNDL